MPTNKYTDQVSHFGNLNIKFHMVGGQAAGDWTISGISTDDTLLAVVGFHKTSYSALADQVSGFSITAANTVNNAGQSSLASYVVLFVWLDADK